MATMRAASSTTAEPRRVNALPTKTSKYGIEQHPKGHVERRVEVDGEEKCWKVSKLQIDSRKDSEEPHPNKHQANYREVGIRAALARLPTFSI
jgi:hypothetical protein